MNLRNRFILLFVGLSLLGNTVLFIVTYDSVENYKVQQAQRNVELFANHLSGVLSLQEGPKGFTRDQLNQLASILPTNYIPVLSHGGVFMLPNETPPPWVKSLLFNPDFVDQYRDPQRHSYLGAEQPMVIWNLVSIPDESAQLLVLHNPASSIWQDYKEVFMLPLTVTGVITTWAAIWIAIILSSLYGKLKQNNIVLSEQKQTIEASLKTLNQVSQAKSQFLANMSHEIRTPLTAIIGFADTSLDQQQTPEERTEALGIIKNCGEHLLHVINEVLDISKIEAGKLEVETAPVELFPLVHSIEAVFRQQAKNKGISFSVHYYFPLPKIIQSDSFRLHQILFNLCSNALKFTDRGHIKLEVRCDSKSERIHFDVTDTGIGISVEQQEKIFESFTQADTSTTRKYGGTGLGLTLSRQLSELLGGTLTLRSEPGQGSCFQLCVTTGRLEQSDFINSVTQIPEKTSVTSFDSADMLLTQASILVAEDNPDNQRLISIYLDKTGADYKMVDNGALALEYLQYHPVDLILLDIQMPVMDGFATLTQIRNNDTSTPIIALTANTLSEDKHRCLDAGFNDFIAKPIDRRDFYTTLAKHLPPDIDVAHCTPVYSNLEQDTDIDFSNAIEHFIMGLPQQLDDLRHFQQRQEWEALGSLLHKLKGAAGGVGFPHLSRLAVNIETALANQDTTAVERLVDDMVNYAGRIKQGPAAAHRADQM